MPTVKYDIVLTDTEREKLKKIVAQGKSSARIILHANILLCSERSRDTYLTVKEAALTYHTSTTTVQKIRTAFIEYGLEKAINRKNRDTPPVAPKITGDVEAHIIALACGKPPEGYNRWTVRLLADKSVELEYVESISPMSISRLLKKMNLSLN